MDLLVTIVCEFWFCSFRWCFVVCARCLPVLFNKRVLLERCIAASIGCFKKTKFHCLAGLWYLFSYTDIKQKIHPHDLGLKLFVITLS